MSLIPPSSKIPEGQPGVRKAWVQRCFERQRSELSAAPRIERIDPARRDFYLSLIEMMQRAQEAGKRVILDSGCGTGESTRRRLGPEQWILGLDKSLARMERGSSQGLEVPIWRDERLPKPGAMDLALRAGGVLVRGELTELVSLMHAHGCIVEQLDFLYPNPWPKTQHFGRRWYGHPIWPYALAVAQRVQLRTNWKIYAQEFAYALGLWVPQAQGEGVVETFALGEQEALTAFEEKYALAGHPLYRVWGCGAAKRST